jgi:DNA-directed RNA polymerase specialized sigma24 family protein
MAPAADQPVVLLGDEDQLYRTHARTLRRVVRIKVNTSDETVEDACAFAWMQLVSCQPRRNTVFAWLRTVATREAIRLDRIERNRRSTELGELEHPALRDLRTDPHTQDEIIDAFDTLASLKDAQRITLGLHALGFRHSEISEITGDTARTVARQMLRARRAVMEHQSPRGERQVSRRL